ncbi:MAG: hypothetical protein ASARMPREDX12_006975 [Alectoria sarmentosa]|nr:MAG: hypothetical protein ASARMPREDX12_006975 [Alectoria sarmentosa]
MAQPPGAISEECELPASKGIGARGQSVANLSKDAKHPGGSPHTHTPTKDLDTLPLHNGRTGELINGIEMENIHRLGRTKLQALLSDGLDEDWEKKMVDIVYLGKRKRVKAVFEDGTEVTGSMLVGADGGRSSVRSLLVGPDIAKPTPIDFATTIWFTKYSRDGALFLRSAPHHPLFQIAPHPDGYYSWLGLHDASDPNHSETWVFWHYISFPEPRELENKKTVAE